MLKCFKIKIKPIEKCDKTTQTDIYDKKQYKNKEDENDKFETTSEISNYYVITSKSNKTYNIPYSEYCAAEAYNAYHDYKINI